MLAKKKEQYLKNKSQLTELSDTPADFEEVANNSSTTEVEEVPYGNSFGQSAGLKDDLDVDDDGIGIYTQLFTISSAAKHLKNRVRYRREEEKGVFGFVNRMFGKRRCTVRPRGSRASRHDYV